jgi:TetR/AcrR family transcriptional repressor of lmrAB and yxaGH operons
MPAALDATEKAEIVSRLFVAFRDHGYEGASLADLSQATGLGKSSLYHHFPRGKEQMAEAVLEQGREFIQSAVADVARSREPLKARVTRIIAAFNELYAGGRNPCVLGRLSLSEIGPTAGRIAGEIFAVWTGAVAELAGESGMSRVRARHFAEDWIARVQGTLILYAANGDCDPFERAMLSLVDLAKPKSGTKATDMAASSGSSR